MKKRRPGCCWKFSNKVWRILHKRLKTFFKRTFPYLYSSTSLVGHKTQVCPSQPPFNEASTSCSQVFKIEYNWLSFFRNFFGPFSLDFVKFPFSSVPWPGLGRGDGMGEAQSSLWPVTFVEPQLDEACQGLSKSCPFHRTFSVIRHFSFVKQIKRNEILKIAPQGKFFF